ncbi:MAG: dTDP-4-dehydrorhamnose 3,5-epimerase [Bacteroidetes bacterium]|nr:dTDP-4-dehydrorhamnose 3,5-epimerase [Bacteroidota bacterium]
MIFTPTPLSGSYLVSLTPLGDKRGWFARTYCKKEFAAIGHTDEWVQLNHSYSASRGTLRGMHYQVKPYTEIKMIRCVVGAVYDVIVDLRSDSPTFLQHYGVELSAENKQMLYIPRGFAHGFQTLEDNTELLYHHSEYYNPGAEAAVKYDDPLLNIEWPLPVSEISGRDKSHPLLTSSFKGI